MIIFQYHQQIFHLPPNTRPYIGVYKADTDLPIPLIMQVRLHKNKLAISISDEVIFFLDYVQPQVFKLHLDPRNSCNKLYTFGVEEDLVLFDVPSSPDGLSGGFILNNAHPSGRTYFARKV